MMNFVLLLSVLVSAVQAQYFLGHSAEDPRYVPWIALRESLIADLAPNGLPIVVPVYVTVARNASGHGATLQMVHDNIAVLNDAFFEKSDKLVDTEQQLFSFEVLEIVEVSDDRRLYIDPIRHSTRVRTPYHKGGWTDLNLYVTDTPAAGYATVPYGISFEGTPLEGDGVSVKYLTMPGNDGASLDTSVGKISTGTGKTLVHEVGHWLGLFHTYQTDLYASASPDFDPTQASGCNPTGDLAWDTPQTNYKFGGCARLEKTVTCTASLFTFVNEPIHNYMSDVDEGCRDNFTFIQRVRMLAFWKLRKTESSECFGIDTAPCHADPTLFESDDTYQGLKCCGSVCLPCTREEFEAKGEVVGHATTLAPSPSAPTAAPTTTPTAAPSSVPTSAPMDVRCHLCFAGTAGSCRQANGVCWEKNGGSCPTGTTPCSELDDSNNPEPQQCSGCWPGTFGVCKQSNTVCHGLLGPGMCPQGTHMCT